MNQVPPRFTAPGNRPAAAAFAIDPATKPCCETPSPRRH
jgi:hypothetical protein